MRELQGVRAAQSITYSQSQKDTAPGASRRDQHACRQKAFDAYVQCMSACREFRSIQSPETQGRGGVSYSLFCLVKDKSCESELQTALSSCITTSAKIRTSY